MDLFPWYFEGPAGSCHAELVFDIAEIMSASLNLSDQFMKHFWANILPFLGLEWTFTPCSLEVASKAAVLMGAQEATKMFTGGCCN